jgi:hypothetical protein
VPISLHNLSCSSPELTVSVAHLILQVPSRFQLSNGRALLNGLKVHSLELREGLDLEHPFSVASLPCEEAANVIIALRSLDNALLWLVSEIQIFACEEAANVIIARRSFDDGRRVMEACIQSLCTALSRDTLTSENLANFYGLFSEWGRH